MTTIVGAGLAGLLAAHAWPNARIIEASSGPLQMHRALLRFRSDGVSKLTGIEFKKVIVRKGIWQYGRFYSPNIALANAYSLKCLNKIQPDRSIWNIDPVERFVAPDSFYDQLIETVGKRVEWGSALTIDAIKNGDQLISTAPLPIVLDLCGIKHETVEFKRAPIVVQRFTLKNCDTYQTVYFPSFSHSVYRASITGSTLIVEHACKAVENIFGDWRTEIANAFSLTQNDLDEAQETVKQSYGKIIPLDQQARQHFLLRLTTENNVYSVGRFGTWRNILLDDVVNDFAVIRRLMKASHYEMMLQS